MDPPPLNKIPGYATDLRVLRTHVQVFKELDAPARSRGGFMVRLLPEHLRNSGYFYKEIYYTDSIYSAHKDKLQNFFL